MKNSERDILTQLLASRCLIRQPCLEDIDKAEFTCLLFDPTQFPAVACCVMFSFPLNISVQGEIRIFCTIPLLKDNCPGGEARKSCARDD